MLVAGLELHARVLSTLALSVAQKLPHAYMYLYDTTTKIEMKHEFIHICIAAMMDILIFNDTEADQNACKRAAYSSTSILYALRFIASSVRNVSYLA